MSYWVTTYAAGGGSGGGTGGTPTKGGYATGGDFIVPSGYPNDSYGIGVSSGERVTISPSYTLNIYGSAVPANVVQEFSMLRSMIGGGV